MPSGSNSGENRGDGTPPKPQLENLCAIAQSVKARNSAESKRIQEREKSLSHEREESGTSSAPHVPGTASREDPSGRLRCPTSVPTSTLGKDRRVLSAFRRDEIDPPETAAKAFQIQKERRAIERRVWEKRKAEFEVNMGRVNMEMESIHASREAAGSDQKKLSRLDRLYTELENELKHLHEDIEIYNRRLADNPEL